MSDTGNWNAERDDHPSVGGWEFRRGALRWPVAGVLFFVVALAGPASAGAHAVFVRTPTSFPVDTVQPLTMNVPHEREDTVYNVGVLVAMPSGWQPLSCQPKPTWTCSVGTEAGHQVVRFGKQAGAPPAEDETFAFTVQTSSTVGTYPFPTVQTYSTGEVVRWIGASGSAEPAPVLRTTAAGTTPGATTPATAPPHTPSASPTTRAAATPSTTAAAPVAPEVQGTTVTSTPGAGGAIVIPGAAGAAHHHDDTGSRPRAVGVAASGQPADASSSPMPWIIGIAVVGLAGIGGFVLFRRRSRRGAHLP